MELTWDEEKRRSNLAKHGLDFADAHEVFRGAVFIFEDSAAATASSDSSHWACCKRS